MILRTSKAGIGSWKLTKVEQRIFGGDCRGGCMHNEGCENKGAPRFYRGLNILCIGDRVVADRVVQLWKRSGSLRLSFLMGSVFEP